MNNGAKVGTSDSLIDQEDSEDAELDRKTAALEKKIRELEKQKSDLQLTQQLSRALLAFTPASVGTPESPVYLAMKARRDAKKATSSQNMTNSSVTSSKIRNPKK